MIFESGGVTASVAHEAQLLRYFNGECMHIWTEMTRPAEAECSCCRRILGLRSVDSPE